MPIVLKWHNNMYGTVPNCNTFIYVYNQMHIYINVLKNVYVGVALLGDPNIKNQKYSNVKK